jgi:D-3-phosphoglycerate dehydrogenase
VNLNCAREIGNAFFNSHFSNTCNLAELMIAEITSFMRRIAERSNATHNGIWLNNATDSFEVRRKYLGIIGYEHIGTQVLILAEAMGMHIYYIDIENKLPHVMQLPKKFR